MSQNQVRGTKKQRYLAVFSALLVNLVVGGIYVDPNITIYSASFIWENDKQADINFFYLVSSYLGYIAILAYPIGINFFNQLCFYYEFFNDIFRHVSR